MEFGEINGHPLTNSTYTLFLQNEDQKYEKKLFSNFIKNTKTTKIHLLILLSQTLKKSLHCKDKKVSKYFFNATLFK